MIQVRKDDIYRYGSAKAIVLGVCRDRADTTIRDLHDETGLSLNVLGVHLRQLEDDGVVELDYVKGKSGLPKMVVVQVNE